MYLATSQLRNIHHYSPPLQWIVLHFNKNCKPFINNSYVLYTFLVTFWKRLKAKIYVRSKIEYLAAATSSNLAFTSNSSDWVLSNATRKLLTDHHFNWCDLSLSIYLCRVLLSGLHCRRPREETFFWTNTKRLLTSLESCSFMLSFTKFLCNRNLCFLQGPFFVRKHFLHVFFLLLSSCLHTKNNLYYNLTLELCDF